MARIITAGLERLGEAPEFTVNVRARPGLLFDYHGFPEHTYRLTWPAPGEPRLATRVGELLEAWFEQAAPDFSPATAKETRGYLDRSLVPGLGGRRLAKLKPGDIDAFYRRLRESGGVNGKPLAPATVRRIHGILRRALAQGVRWGWIGVNPAASASPPKVPPAKVAPPDPEQLARLLARARGESPELACYVLVAAALPLIMRSTLRVFMLPPGLLRPCRSGQFWPWPRPGWPQRRHSCRRRRRFRPGQCR